MGKRITLKCKCGAWATFHGDTAEQVIEYILNFYAIDTTGWIDRPEGDLCPKCAEKKEREEDK